MTAASVIARAFAIAAPLPFLYSAFPVEAVAFWLTMVTFQSLVGAFSGIVPTVAIQMIAYARSGSSAVGGSVDDHSRERTEGPNWPLIAQVNGVTRRLFAAIAGGWGLFAAGIGTWIVWRPMIASGIAPEAAVAWGIFILGSAMRLWIQQYAAFGQGLGAVASVRRQEALSAVIGSLAAIAILALIPNLALAMLAMQAPILVTAVQYKRLARSLGWSVPATGGRSPVMGEIWSRSWRGGVGQIAATLTIYGSGFIYAQVGSGAAIAGFLLGLNILGIVGQIAISPLYAAIPVLAARYAEGRLTDMNALAQRVIGRSMWIFVGLVLLVPGGILAINHVLPEPLAFPEGGLWLAMCVSAIIVRHGADHLQYYTTTNDVRWHRVNTIFLALSLGPFIVLPASNILLVVLVQGAAAALFYLPYSRALTLRRLQYGLSREWRDFLLPLAVMLAGLSAWWWWTLPAR